MFYYIDNTPACGVPFHARILPLVKFLLRMD